MIRMHQWIGLAVISFMLTGCVAQEKYNALKLERDQFAERLGQAEAEARSERSKAEVLQKQLDALLGAQGSQQDLVANLTRQNAQLQAALDELNKKYADALNRPMSLGSPLPEPLDRALREFAEQNPGLVEYDAAHGTVKFKSDVTFATGSAEVTARAKDVIAKFAQILNSPAAAGFEFMIAGHTDSQPVVNPATIAAGHKDNWYLSAHRAISVSNEMRRHRVSEQRMAVVGYADQHPVASNSTAEGRAQNRRVEVIILPTMARNAAAPVKATKSMNKDTVAPAPAPAPALNK